MRVWLLLSRLLSIAVIAGLLIAPVVTSPLAGTMTADSMMAMPDMGSMMDAMTGCQSGENQAPDCQNACSVTMGCVANCLPGTDATAAANFPKRALTGMIARNSDYRGEQLVGPPPLEPPRA